MPDWSVASDETLREAVIGCAIAIHRELGPGLLESIYRDCLLLELRAAGISVIREHAVPVSYRGQTLSRTLKTDLMIEGRLIIEVKAVDKINTVHLAQVITYLKLTGCPHGLLINFNVTSLRLGGLRRVDHPSIYGARCR